MNGASPHIPQPAAHRWHRPAASPGWPGRWVFPAGRSRLVQHLLFWSAYFTFWTLAMPETRSPEGVLINLTYLACHAGATYLTIYGILPFALRTQRYVAGTAVFVPVIVLCALPIGLVSYLSDPAPGWTWYFLSWEAVGSVYFSTLLTVLLLTGVHLVRRQRTLMQHAQQMETERLAAELDFLRAQINPHFLFNAINSIYFLIRKDPDLAAGTLLRFSDLLRYQIYECSTDRVAIEHELAYLHNYVELERLRKSSRTEVVFEQEGLLSGYQIAPFLLIPFIENAFKHVSAPPDQPARIRIRLAGSPDQLSLEVRNTREALPGPQAPGGVGLANVTRRLELLYPGRHRLLIRPEDGAFYTSLTLDLHADPMPDRR